MPGRHGDIDANPVGVPFLMSVVGLLDRYITPIDMIAEFLQPGRIFQNQVVDLFGFLETTVGDVNRQLHDLTSYCRNVAYKSLHFGPTGSFSPDPPLQIETLIL